MALIIPRGWHTGRRGFLFDRRTPLILPGNGGSKKPFSDMVGDLFLRYNASSTFGSYDLIFPLKIEAWQEYGTDWGLRSGHVVYPVIIEYRDNEPYAMNIPLATAALVSQYIKNNIFIMDKGRRYVINFYDGAHSVFVPENRTLALNENPDYPKSEYMYFYLDGRLPFYGRTDITYKYALALFKPTLNAPSSGSYRNWNGDLIGYVTELKDLNRVWNY